MPGKRKPTSTDLEEQGHELIPHTQDTQPETDGDGPQAAPQKKKYRQSKKEIPDYNWTRETNQRLGEFVEEHEELYDKRAREWLNVETKNRLWTLAGQELDPTATGAQCKKQYENMRTRVGKLIRKESKSGSGPPDRSQRDYDLLEAWGFLQSHISSGASHTTEQFSQFSQPPETDQPDHPSADPPSVSSSTGLSSPRENTRLLDTTPDRSAQLRDTFLNILSTADRSGYSESGCLTVHEQLIKDFSALLETHMRRIPEDAWHHFQIDALNLVARYASPPQPAQQPYRTPKIEID